MAGSLTASVHEHHAEASEIPRWLISFARFVPFPSSPSPYPGLDPLGKSELSSSPDGTWLSTVNLRLVDEVNRSGAILSVQLAGKILEEHYISKLNFSWWPCITSVSELPPRGSRAILVSYMDSENEIQKFALRFSTCDAAVTFVAALKEKLKGLEEAGLQEREPDTSFQSDYNPGNETIPRATVEEPNMVKHLGSYVPEMQARLEYQDGKILHPPQSTLSHISNENCSNLPPNFTTLPSGCFPNSTLDAGQTTVKQDPGLKSQILEKLKGLEEVGIQERETRSETSFQSDYNPGNEIISSYVPEMQPRLEYEEIPEGSAALLAKNSQTPRQGNVAGKSDATVMEAENLARLVPNPASKPACPDPVGLDENEKDKTRAREKQLEEARRLASLHRKRKPDRIDYEAAIRFQKRAPADEDRPALPTTTTEGLEAQLDVARNKISQGQDAPAAILQANMLNDPESTWKRPKLMLPSDNDFEGIPKMGYATDLLAENEELPEGSAALLAKNSQTPRQGSVAGKVDAIVLKAEKIQTPDPMLSPSINPAAAALTPRIGLTPARDELHLNGEDMDNMDESEELMRGEKAEPEAEEDA
ncbi:Uncharacterized protein Rs2_22403 [Raphanus sativus]|uniref:Uncharacterized protein LOC108856195 isoform X2 n=1 Tax=Raphanus sativus TaxID=3726 RepID=A0A6J0NLC8_RAPSA|nr:uncharacterized protein LOC108856195 isoform X2 [Raphanus sativus]KAJ4895609.1 Uncharacterized protein Rs2_22403 [Raphanus sativus]